MRRGWRQRRRKKPELTTLMEEEWRMAPVEDGPQALIVTCPKCNLPIVVTLGPLHAIKADGHLQPILYCKRDGCGWGGDCYLRGWAART